MSFADMSMDRFDPAHSEWATENELMEARVDQLVEEYGQEGGISLLAEHDDENLLCELVERCLESGDIDEFRNRVENIKQQVAIEKAGGEFPS